MAASIDALCFRTVTEWLDVMRDDYTAQHRVETFNRLLQSTRRPLYVVGEVLAWDALLHLEFGMAVTATEVKMHKQALSHLAECHRPMEEVRVRLDRSMQSMPETRDDMRNELRIMNIDVNMQRCVAESHQAYALAQKVSMVML
jgi:hypothetical protein